MKTGMEYPLIGLVILLALVGLWNAWSEMQVEIASASLQAMVAGESAPAPAILAGEWIVKALVGALAGGTVTAVVAALIVWARRQWTAQGGGWKAGPNAQWARPERAPRAPSESELYRMMLMQQMQQNGGRAVSPARLMEPDDEPVIHL
jgi:hypothetical protein